MKTYKQAINELSDVKLLHALNLYHNCVLDLRDPEWHKTVIEYVRKDYALEVDTDTGSVSIRGDEHMNYFGEFIMFDYNPPMEIIITKQDSGVASTLWASTFCMDDLTLVAPNVYYGCDGTTFLIK